VARLWNEAEGLGVGDGVSSGVGSGYGIGVGNGVVAGVERPVRGSRCPRSDEVSGKSRKPTRPSSE
jgi:hypothetical protein